jgi:hypothetical protein
VLENLEKPLMTNKRIVIKTAFDSVGCQHAKTKKNLLMLEKKPMPGLSANRIQLMAAVRKTPIALQKF